MADRGRPKAELTLTEDEREQLVRWSRRAKSAQALALRCRIVLACAQVNPTNRSRRSRGRAGDGEQVAAAVRGTAAGGSARRAAPGWAAHDQRRTGRGGDRRDAGTQPERCDALVPSLDGRRDRIVALDDRADLAASSGSNRIWSTPSSCPPIRSSSRRSATSSGSISTPGARRWSCVSMRKAGFRRWTALRRCCR